MMIELTCSIEVIMALILETTEIIVLITVAVLNLKNDDIRLREELEAKNETVNTKLIDLLHTEVNSLYGRVIYLEIKVNNDFLSKKEYYELKNKEFIWLNYIKEINKWIDIKCENKEKNIKRPEIPHLLHDDLEKIEKKSKQKKK